MKKIVLKESEEYVCDICETVIDYTDSRRGFLRTDTYDWELCRGCINTVVVPFLESKKLTK